MILIIFNILFVLLFTTLTIMSFQSFKDASENYLQDYKNYLINFGPDFLQAYKKALRNYYWKIVVLVSCVLELLIFICSLIHFIIKYPNT